MAPLKAISLLIWSCLVGCAQVPWTTQPQVIAGPIVDGEAIPVIRQKKPEEPKTITGRLDEMDATVKRMNDVLDAHDNK